MKVILDFLRKILTNITLPFWMTTVHVVVPWKWLTLKRVFKSFIINVVICSVEGGTVKDPDTGERHEMTGAEKQQAVYATLSVLVYAGWIESEEALREAINGGVAQLNSLKILKH